MTFCALTLFQQSPFVSFNLGLALLANNMDSRALDKYREAVDTFPQDAAELGLVDVQEATGSWLTPERAAAVLVILHAREREISAD